MSINYDILPEGLRNEARRYIEEGVRPGRFLVAVTTNDVAGAYDAAIDDDLERLGSVLCFWCTEAPTDCWGSKQEMDAWIKAKAAERSAKGGK